MLSRHLVLLSVGKALRTANQIRVTRGAHSSDSTNCWEGGKGGFGRSGTDFLVLYNQWQRNRFYFGEANQFQLSLGTMVKILSQVQTRHAKSSMIEL
jgi:hypothetical protein